MRSRLVKFNAKVAFMSLALVGLLAGCSKDDNDAPAPGGAEPTYEVQATITDFATNDALQGATVKVGEENGTTDANGKCSIKAVVGKNTVIIAKDGYKTVTTEVTIAKVESGKGIGLVTAALKVGSDKPTYKTVQYNVKATVTDKTDGKAISVKSAFSPTIIAAKIVTSGNTISITDVKPGTYTLTVGSDGYTTSATDITVTEIQGEEGPETEIQMHETAADIKLAKKEVAAPTYAISGTVTDQTGVSLKSISVRAKIGNDLIGEMTTQADGKYVFDIPTNKVVAGGSIVSLSVAETDTYMAAVATGKLSMITTGTSNVTANLVLLTKKIEVEEDGSQADAGNIEIPVEETKVGEIENATAEKPTSSADISNALEEQLKGTETTKEEIKAVADIIEQMQKENKIDNVSKVAVVPVVNETKITVTSKVSETPVEGGETPTITEQKDEVIIPKGSVVVFPTGTAQNITIARDLATEKETVAERVYEGKPSGATFTKPMIIQFEAPVKTDEIQFCVLYYNEADKTWKADANNYATYKDGKYEGSIKHFSKIKFGFETAVEQDGTDKQTGYLARPCFTAEASAVAHVTVKSALTGSRFANGVTKDVVAKALPGMEAATIAYVTKTLNELISANNNNTLPAGIEFGKGEYKADITIPAYAQVEGFNITYNLETVNYAITVISKAKAEVTIVVPVEKVTGVSIESKYTISHGHGHGHGSDLNAGGGIIDFE